MLHLGLRLATSSSRGVARLVPACKHGRWVRSRDYHARKRLRYPVENGLGEFMSPQVLKLIAEDYQTGLLERLNDQVRGTVLENKSVAQTAIEAARDPHKVLEFDFACEALNNSFFLESMRPPPPSSNSNEADLTSEKGAWLYHTIKTQFGSLEQFKSNFSAAVLGMFSSGWMYLVLDKTGQLAICPIFGTGTLLVRSGKSWLGMERIVGEIIAQGRVLQTTPPPSPATSSQPDTQSSPSSPASGMSQPSPSVQPPAHTRALSTGPTADPFPGADFSTSPNSLFTANNSFVPIPENSKTKQEKVGEVGKVLYPLFCVSVHERAWVPSYGVWGKEEYMKRFWTVLDWEAAAKRFDKFYRSA